MGGVGLALKVGEAVRVGLPVRVAVREGVNFNFSADGETTLTQGVRTAAATAQGAAQSGLEGLGVGSFDLMDGSGMMAFWIVAGALVAVLAAGLVKLSQDV